MRLLGLAWADLDSFPLSTLEPYRSIVTRRSPAESRPPSIYRLVWQGRYYQLWQRPVHPSTSILEHVPFGESNALPYCGGAVNGPTEPVCSLDPAAMPPCRQLQGLARKALRENAQLVTYARPEPITVRADQISRPGAWIQGSEGRALAPTKPGTAISHIAIARGQRYELWLDGSFARGFEVSVDGRRVGRVKDELGGWVQVADLSLTAGIHTFALAYPHADLTPGSGDNESTILTVIALQPQSPPSELIAVSPQHAARLCGRPLDWIELVEDVKLISRTFVDIAEPHRARPRRLPVRSMRRCAGAPGSDRVKLRSQPLRADSIKQVLMPGPSSRKGTGRGCRTAPAA